jgi:hypothetical protein
MRRIKLKSKDATVIRQLAKCSDNNHEETSSDVTMRSKRVCGRRRHSEYMIGGRGSANWGAEIQQMSGVVDLMGTSLPVYSKIR